MAKLSASQQKFAREAYQAAYAAGLRGVQADLAVAQAALESAWGTDPSGTNNVHGIKGKTGTTAPTQEVVNGKLVTEMGTFLDFSSLTESFKAWKEKIEQKWTGVTKAKTMKEAIAALKPGQQGGYATLQAEKYTSRVNDVASLTKAYSPESINKAAHTQYGNSRAVAAGEALTPSQKESVGTLHPAVRDRAAAFLKEANKRGLNLSVEQAKRSQAEQNALYEQGRTKPGAIVTGTKNSLHIDGLAFDVVPADLKETKNWSPEDPRWDKIGALAKEFGFEWGGDWKSLIDKPHIQVGEVKKGQVDLDGDGYPDLSPLDDLDARKGMLFSPPTPTSRPALASPQQQALANAHIAYGASRALNQQPLSPPNPGALRGLATSMSRRGISPPSNFSGGTPAISPIGSAPVGLVTRSPLGPALARPSPPSNFAQGAPVSYAASKANRLGGMDYAVAPERFDRPSVPSGIDRPGPPTSRPSLSSPPGLDRPGPVASRPSLSSPVGLDKPGAPASRPSLSSPVGIDKPGPPASRPSLATPVGISRPAAPSQATIQGALSQAQGKIAADAKAYADFESARALGLSSLPAPPAALPTVAAPAPALVTRPPAVNYPVVNVPAAQNIGPPRENFSYAAPTASDVYSGRAAVGYDSVGNRVSSIPGGTSVTNKYGATTGMVGGYQTAVGSMPSIPGMSMPAKSTIGGAVKGAVVGSSLGPLGALAGAALGAAIAKAAAEKNGTAAASGQSGGGLLGGLFGGGASGASSSKSSGSSKSGSSTSRSGGGGYQTSAGAQSNSKSMRY